MCLDGEGVRAVRGVESGCNAAGRRVWGCLARVGPVVARVGRSLCAQVRPYRDDLIWMSGDVPHFLSC